MRIADDIIKQVIELRKRSGMTQEAIAAALNINRQTYLQVEQGRRSLNLQELEILAGVFGIPIADFFTQPIDMQKFEQMYLYILKKLGSVTKTKLAKLLYLADFGNFYETLEPISGVRYVCRTYGPVPDVFFELTDELFDMGRISITPQEDALIIRATSSEFSTDALSAEELDFIDEIVDLWRNKRTQEIVNFTHEQKPWRASRNGEYIPYELIIQEDPDHVYQPFT
ncbi:MAG: DUF4065 domain-containing protein [Coriobacteriia bacterium]|nr:DUF4065 domain-containing protein [Coriobacteriia bacterium]